MNILLAIHIPQTCIGISKSGPFFLKKESEKTGGDEEEEGVDVGLAGCFHSCHGDELGSYD